MKVNISTSLTLTHEERSMFAALWSEISDTTMDAVVGTYGYDRARLYAFADEVDKALDAAPHNRSTFP